jgi:uncharacterized cupredoxin-like copper-binding protein
LGRTLLKTTAALAVLGLGLGVAACGDDDDDAAETTTTAAEADTASFCDSVVEFNTAVFQVELDEDSSEADIKAAGAQVGPLMQAIVDSAPSDLKDSAEELNDAVQPLNEGDAGPFNEDATYEKYNDFVSDAVPQCDFDKVAIDAVDYAFQGVPKSVAAGTVSFTLTNKSEGEQHEMVVFRRAEGETRPLTELLALPEEQMEDEASSPLVFTSAAQAEPGESGSTLAELEPGDYAMVCFIPVGGAEDGEPHFTRGMVSEFTVE